MISTAFTLAGDVVSTGDWIVLALIAGALPVLFYARAEYDRWRRRRDIDRRAEARRGHIEERW